jgi:hypothetical protein
VAPGKYDINLQDRDGGISINQMLVVTAEEPNPALTVEWPKGTASIRDTVDAPVRERLGRAFTLVSRNVRWRSSVPVDASGRLELGGIPAGEYSLILQRSRAGGSVHATVKEFQLAEGENKTLDVAKDAIPQSELAKEIVRVSVFTPEGIPLTGCEIRLAGPAGLPPLPKPMLSQWAIKWFALPPGSYNLVATYLGAESATQTVEVRPVLKDGDWTTHDHVVNLTLTPIE